MTKIQGIICFVLGSSVAMVYGVPLRPYLLSKVCKKPFEKCKACEDPVKTEECCRFVARVQEFIHGEKVVWKNVVYATPVPGDNAHMVVYGCVWDMVTYKESNERNGTIYMYWNPDGRALSADPNIRQVCHDPTISTVETTTREGQGCCIKPGIGDAVYHRYCSCEKMSVDDCELLCTKDRECKGYVLELDYCNLATTSRYCPNKCGNPIHPTHVAELDARATCNWDAGLCKIKEKQLQ